MKVPSEEDKQATAYKQLKVNGQIWLDNTFGKHEYMFVTWKKDRISYVLIIERNILSQLET